MAEHNTLTGASLHEPKGAESALINTTYVSDGAGSGSWTTLAFANFTDISEMPVQADSVAADVATIVTDFNSLLAKLKTAGLMASS